MVGWFQTVEGLYWCWLVGRLRGCCQVRIVSLEGNTRLGRRLSKPPTRWHCRLILSLPTPFMVVAEIIEVSLLVTRHPAHGKRCLGVLELATHMGADRATRWCWGAIAVFTNKGLPRWMEPGGRVYNWDSAGVSSPQPQPALRATPSATQG